MTNDAVFEEASGRATSARVGYAFEGVVRPYRVPQTARLALLVAGALLGALGDALLRTPGDPFGLNVLVWVASVAVAAIVLQRRAGLTFDRERVVWLGVGVVFAAGLAWRDSGPLKFFALWCATLAFALAAYRPVAAWVRQSGVVRYAGALVLGAVHAWTATSLAVLSTAWPEARSVSGRALAWRRALAIVRGLAIAAPLVLLFGVLLMSADDVFAQIVSNAVHIDFEWVASHVVPFSVFSWIATGYLHGFLTGTELRWAAGTTDDGEVRATRWQLIGITEVAVALGAIDLLFFAFVVVQLRYLFGADTLVRITPGLTYAEYARHGFFELVFAVALVVPVLLMADWLLKRRVPRDTVIFRALAGVQIGLVLAIAMSALERMRLYYASYGLTELRLYVAVALVWMSAMLLWLAATVLRGRRNAFAFGTLVSAFSTVVLLFVVNPDAVIARADVARMSSADASVRFDVAYAASLSADAAPVLLDALPTLPDDVRKRLAHHLLQQWREDRVHSVLNWNWSAARANRAMRDREAELLTAAGE